MKFFFFDKFPEQHRSNLKNKRDQLLKDKAEREKLTGIDVRHKHVTMSVSCNICTIDNSAFRQVTITDRYL